MPSSATAPLFDAARCYGIGFQPGYAVIAHGWFDRAHSNFMALGMMAPRAQAAALSPLRTAVAANTERLA